MDSVVARGTSESRAKGSLRDRKKEQLRSQVLRVATQLFRDRGFERTRIEDIAAAANVGVATVYNYFSTKQQILVEIVHQNTDDAQPKIEAAARVDYKDPVDALTELMNADFGDVNDADKALWRELLASMTSDQENRADIEANRMRFRRHLKDVIKRMIRNRKIRRDADVNALVDVCYAIYAYHFRQLVCIEGITKAKAMQSIRRDLRTLLSGVRAG
jgi:AcrR family transcriptional regulator